MRMIEIAEKAKFLGVTTIGIDYLKKTFAVFDAGHHGTFELIVATYISTKEGTHQKAYATRTWRGVDGMMSFVGCSKEVCRILIAKAWPHAVVNDDCEIN